MSADVNTKLLGEMSCVAGRLSHNEEERYIAVMKELQFGEPLSYLFIVLVLPTQKCSILVIISYSFAVTFHNFTENYHYCTLTYVLCCFSFWF